MTTVIKVEGISKTFKIHHERHQSLKERTLHPRSGSTETFNARLRAAMPNTVWTTGCSSWYLNKDGVPEVWPFTPAKHREMLANPDPGQYEFRPAGSSSLSEA